MHACVGVRLRLRMSGLLGRAWARAVPSVCADAEPTNHQPTVQPTNLGGSARCEGGIGLLAPGRAAGLRIWHPARPRLGFPIPIPSARACLPRLPDSLQPFPPVSPERGGASCLPRPANRLSSCRYARPAFPKTRDPANQQSAWLADPRSSPRRRYRRSLPSGFARLPRQSGASGCSTGAAV
jgi:hypothetical protein